MRVRAIDLHYAVAGKEILKGLNFCLSEGETTALLGPNGAGKTSLLRLLAGEVAPTSGKLEFIGMDVRTMARRRAVLPQSSSLNFDFTALEVALMGRYPHHKGRESKKDVEIARMALAEAGVEHLAERLYTRLSGGEKQRVHFARALAQIWEEPGLLLLDEPTAHLDPSFQHKLLQTAKAMAARGAAVLVILHDFNLAAQYAERLLLLNEGILTGYGCACEVLTPQSIEAVFHLKSAVVPHPYLNCPLVLPLNANPQC
ncbi:MAG: heme ABC transporter ATP-binding protein [Bacteroidia bacterium]|nr:heme ABC transporter ATP-binding protein [Bacteroidia bacterium]MDW8334012.1 heme ABC transporter ATP-binding protein [Bacteroidia bacterium]